MAPRWFKGSSQYAPLPEKELPVKQRKNSHDSTATTAASETDASRPQTPPRTHIPDIRKEHDWFNHWDIHGFGMLSKAEATTAIQQTYSYLNAEKLSCIIDTRWPEFDKDGSGVIGVEGMLRKQTGLVDSSLHMYQLAAIVERRKQAPPTMQCTATIHSL